MKSIQLKASLNTVGNDYFNRQRFHLINYKNRKKEIKIAFLPLTKMGQTWVYHIDGSYILRVLDLIYKIETDAEGRQVHMRLVAHNIYKPSRHSVHYNGKTRLITTGLALL